MAQPHTANDIGARFRALHAGPGAFVIPNPWDVGTAKLLAGLGFTALATTSSGFAFTHGLPDGAVDHDRVLAHCRALVAAVDVPVSADLEKGLGDSPESAAETIRAAAETGLAGCSLEDFTGDKADPVYSFELAVERIAAAAEAKRALGRDFVLTARAENFILGRPDLDDTIRRLQAFEAAGADVLYAPGLPDLDAIRTVCGAVGRPVNVLVHRPVDYTVADLAAAGVRRVSVGGLLARTAFGALIRAAKELRESGSFDFATGAAPTAEIVGYFGPSSAA